MMKKKIQSGISWLDALLPGGFGQVNGITGPYGSGKSTLACMIAVEAARRARSDRASYLFAYEDVDLTKRRALSYCFKVPTEAASSEAYEAHRRGHLEQSDVEAIQRLKIIDCDISERKGRGIADLADDLQKEYDPAPCCVIIDYVGAMASMAANDEVFRERQVIRNTITDARKLLAAKYGCVVWLVYQLSGKENHITAHGRKIRQSRSADGLQVRQLDTTIAIGRDSESKRRFEARCRKDAGEVYARHCGDIAEFTPVKWEDSEPDYAAREPTWRDMPW